MGLFSSTPEKAKPDPTKRSNRKLCWEARDDFFQCLDKINVDDPRVDSKSDEGKKIKQNCGNFEQKYEDNCIESWVAYFKEKRVYDLLKARKIAKWESEGVADINTAVKK